MLLTSGKRGDTTDMCIFVACVVGSTLGWCWACWRSERVDARHLVEVVGEMRLCLGRWLIVGPVGQRWALLPALHGHSFQVPGPVRGWVLPRLHAAVYWEPLDEAREGCTITRQSVLDQAFRVWPCDRAALAEGQLPARVRAKVVLDSLLVHAIASLAAGVLCVPCIAVLPPSISGLACAVLLSTAFVLSTVHLRGQLHRPRVRAYTGVVWLWHPRRLLMHATETMVEKSWLVPHSLGQRLESQSTVRVFVLERAGAVLAIEHIAAATVLGPRRTEPEIDAALDDFRDAFHHAPARPTSTGV